MHPADARGDDRFVAGPHRASCCARSSICPRAAPSARCSARCWTTGCSAPNWSASIPTISPMAGRRTRASSPCSTPRPARPPRCSTPARSPRSAPPPPRPPRPTRSRGRTPLSLAILGYGEQAQRHVEAIRCVRPIERLTVWGRDPAKAAAFAERFGGEACASVAEAVAGADIICAVSAAPEPILLSEWVRRRRPYQRGRLVARRAGRDRQCAGRPRPLLRRP